MLSVTVFVFIAFMMYWWASQGLFSSFLNLICTILAGVLAFALWEAMVLGFLISRMPEYAWGVGLLVPFGLILLGLRVASDRLIGGNLNFHNIADQSVGAVFGGLAGIITVGMLLIGLQMTAMPGLMGYKGGWDIDAEGNAVKQDGVFMGVDRTTAAFFTTMSRFSFAPTFSSVNLNNTHPNLSQEAGFFHRGASEFSRRVIRPGNASLVVEDTEAGKVVHVFKPSPVPVWLEEKLPLSPGNKFTPYVIGTNIKVQGAAADQDGTFRIARGQIGLVYSDNDAFPIYRVAYPWGYFQDGGYAKFASTEDYAYSLPSMADVTHHWLFLVPEGHTPKFLRVKNLRIDLPDKFAGALPPGLTDEDGSTGPVVAVEGQVEVAPTERDWIARDAALPFQTSTNKLGVQGVDHHEEPNARRNKNFYLRGTAKIYPRKRGEPRPGPNIAVDYFYAPNNAAIIQANLGTKDGEGLLGRILSHEDVSKQPFVIDNTGKRFAAIGFARGNNAQMVISFDPNKPVRELAETDPGKVASGQWLILYFQVPTGRSIVAFRYGRTFTPVSPPIPVD